MFTKHILIKDLDPQYMKNSWTQQEGDNAVENWAEDPRRLLTEKMQGWRPGCERSPALVTESQINRTTEH